MIFNTEHDLLERGKKYFIVNKIFFGEPVVIRDKCIYIGEFVENNSISNYDYVFSYFTDISIIHKMENDSLVSTFQNYYIKKEMERQKEIRENATKIQKNKLRFSLSNRNYYFFTCNVTNELLEEIRCKYRVSVIKWELLGLWYIPINDSDVVPFFIGEKYRESKASWLIK